MITIDKGVKIPDRYSRYPFKQMDIGDSFVLKKEKARSVVASAAKQKKINGRVFVVRKISDDEYRCWRVE